MSARDPTTEELPAWNNQPIDKLDRSSLLWTTIVGVHGRKKEFKKKPCIFCFKKYVGGPTNIEQHLDNMVYSKNIAACKPASKFIDRHTEAVAKLRIIRKQNDEATEAANERKRLKA
jgi:hypothetical protein